ncbi:hypothetical protein ANANG_G00160290 [Anguilla anguilla]|uniref:Receptor expression-enhancing protein n=1 Tax=Anguilla anguilla TaxID=7936 RepID=A0A9D3MBF4_ANGAN|nr:hypothetical protein ANANG_G00160290 [Anguilla anguilla]
MVSWMISRTVVLAFGILYPAYSSYKAVKTKNVKEYVKWMMYWIVFAIFTTVETVTDLVLSWFPFYFELKIAFVIWLLSPYTKGSSVLYRKFVHPTLSKKEKEIDEYISQARDRSYDTMMRFGKRGLNLAANAAVTAASKGQDVLSEKLRSFSMHDLTLIQDEDELRLRKADARPAALRALGMTWESGALCPVLKAHPVKVQNQYSVLLGNVVHTGSHDTPPSDESRPSSKADGDQSDARTEQSDEDAGEKVVKRTASVKAKKPRRGEDREQDGEETTKEEDLAYWQRYRGNALSGLTPAPT